MEDVAEDTPARRAGFSDPFAYVHGLSGSWNLKLGSSSAIVRLLGSFGGQSSSIVDGSEQVYQRDVR